MVMDVTSPNWRRNVMPWFLIMWSVPAVLIIGGGVSLIQHVY
jgi:hypothetical protein